MLARMWRDWNPRAPLEWVGRVVKWRCHSRQKDVDALKIKNIITLWPSNPPSMSIPKRKGRRDIGTPLHTAALFTIAKRCKELKYPSMDKVIRRMWSIHTTGYDSASERKGGMPHATAWMTLKDIPLSEISRSSKDKMCISTHTFYPKESNS